MGLLGSLTGSGGASKAAKAMVAYAQEAIKTQRDSLENARKNFNPWIDTGHAANTKLSDFMGLSGNTGADGYGFLTDRFDNSDFEKDPGYDFRQAEGEKAINRGQAARGNFLSGAAMKALDKYNQDYASNEYMNAYNRYTNDQNNLFSRLFGVSNQGLGAAGTLQGSEQAYADAVSNLLLQQGNARAASAMAKSEGMGGLLGTLAGAGLSYATGGLSGLGQFAGLSALGGGMGGGLPTSSPLSSLLGSVSQYGSGAGLWGGYDPRTGIIWNSGR